MTPAIDDPIVAATLEEIGDRKVRGMARSIAIDPTLNEGVLAMMERASDFRSRLTALLSGIAMIPQARRLLNEQMDAMWEKNGISNRRYPEVIIGAGLHAAIYCAARALMGLKAPLVLEAGPRAGGIFASSTSPTFFLNSRNRPGDLSIPGSMGALNVLPGATLQPADLSGEEYQVNADLAFVIRTTFALSGAKVVTNAKVTQVTVEQSRSSSYRYVNGRYRYVYDYFTRVQTESGRMLRADRAIIASGIGRPTQGFWPEAKATGRLVNFPEFMAMMDRAFPLRGMRKVAVIGAGDSGKTVIEALTGQGPTRHWSVASLDWPVEITWFGQDNPNRQNFETCNRPRYKRLGTLLDQGLYRRSRVTASANRVGYVDPGYDCVLVDGQPFDLAVDCTGFIEQDVSPNDGATYSNIFESVARAYPRTGTDDRERILYIGPCAQLPRTPQERMATPDAPSAAAQREALVSMYRYAGRTAMLAKILAKQDADLAAF